MGGRVLLASMFYSPGVTFASCGHVARSDAMRLHPALSRSPPIPRLLPENSAAGLGLGPFPRYERVRAKGKKAGKEEGKGFQGERAYLQKAFIFFLNTKLPHKSCSRCSDAPPACGSFRTTRSSRAGKGQRADATRIRRVIAGPPRRQKLLDTIWQHMSVSRADLGGGGGTPAAVRGDGEYRGGRGIRGRESPGRAAGFIRSGTCR